MQRLTSLTLLICFLFAFFLLGCDGNGCGTSHSEDQKAIRPIVFVHGMAGSGDQFESQFLRFASNGYPENYFTGFDHNTIADGTRQERLDATIDEVLRTTGADKIDLVGHSMGTAVSQNYLSESSQAAKVAHYVNVDGNAARALPGNVPSMSIIATMGGEIANGENVYLTNNTHVQAVSSPEVFASMYEFFTGEAPVTTQILPSSSDTIALKGRIVNFITNIVQEDATISIYEVDPATGHRLSSQPAYVKEPVSDGSFAFLNAKQGASYEFNVTLPDSEQQGHWYYEPFVRTDTMIRLKFTAPGSALFNMMDTSPTASSVTVVRNREMLGDDSGGGGVDSLRINGTEVCEDILPGGADISSSGPIGLLIYDLNSDGVSDLSSMGDTFSAIPFVNSIDLVIPAAAAADSTVEVVLQDRCSGLTQTVHVPNYPSDEHKMFVQFLSR